MQVNLYDTFSQMWQCRNDIQVGVCNIMTNVYHFQRD